MSIDRIDWRNRENQEKVGRHCRSDKSEGWENQEKGGIFNVPKLFVVFFDKNTSFFWPFMINSMIDTAPIYYKKLCIFGQILLKIKSDIVVT